MYTEFWCGDFLENGCFQCEEGGVRITLSRVARTVNEDGRWMQVPLKRVQWWFWFGIAVLSTKSSSSAVTQLVLSSGESDPMITVRRNLRFVLYKHHAFLWLVY